MVNPAGRPPRPHPAVNRPEERGRFHTAMTTLSFAPFADKMRAAGLPQIAIDTFAYYVEKLRAGDAGTVSEADIDPVDTVTDAGTLGTYTSAGRDALKRAVVIKLNGGLGTTMGMTRAKSLLPAKQGLSFLDISVRQILHLRQAHDVGLPLLLMNSFRTRDDSLAVLRGYPELAVPGLPADFLQHSEPRWRFGDDFHQFKDFLRQFLLQRG